jgi:hypothetical protein
VFDFFEDAYDSVTQAFNGPEGDPPVPGDSPEAGAEAGDDTGFLASAGQFLGDWGRGIDQEGIGGVFDPFGAVDRQEAQRELADRFQIVGEGEGGDAENQVSQEEYQELARTYSNIRMGRSDIEFNTEGLEGEEADAFREGMMNDLASIMQTEGGRSMIGQLSDNEDDHTTTLSPLFNKNDENEYDASLGRNYDNGFAQADNIRDAYRVDADTAGEGTDSRVRINPGTEIAPGDADLDQDRWLPWRSDVLLYHELVHSMEHTSGTMERGNVGADAGGVRNVEGDDESDPWDARQNRREHRAAGIGNYADEAISENAYRAARREIGANGFGERGGDDDMADRDTYAYHQRTAGSSGDGGDPGARPAHPHQHDDDDHDH